MWARSTTCCRTGSETLYREIDGLREVYVYLVSRIGTPIDKPRAAAAQIVPGHGQNVADIAPRAREIISRELAGIEGFCKVLSEGKYPVC